MCRATALIQHSNLVPWVETDGKACEYEMNRIAMIHLHASAFPTFMQYSGHATFPTADFLKWN